MTSWNVLVQLQDLDLLLEEAYAVPRARGIAGAVPAGLAAVERARRQVHARLDPRWLQAYERARQRYGRAVVAVRDRVCQGCFITLPTSAASNVDALTICESCGRILFWR